MIDLTSHVSRIRNLAIFVFFISAGAGRTQPQSATSIPLQLYGKWRIQRIIPTRTISCWDDREARKILGTEVNYSSRLFRWKNYSVINPSAKSQTFTAEAFREEYSGGGPNDSNVNFQQLRIHAPSITIVSISHPDANFTGGTVEIPGDTILLKGRDRIILTVCNVYFEAALIGAKKPIH